MLVLTRKKDETIRVVITREAMLQALAEIEQTKQPITVTTSVVKTGVRTTKLGITAPPYFKVVRGEIAVHDTPTTQEQVET